MDKTKPITIPKRDVWEAYKHVKANKGAAGVDGVSIDDFENDLKNNLYRIWNRMSSGSYFPPAVLTVEIPKGDGSKRKLGIPTVSDRVAQMVVKTYLEPGMEEVFHEDSYGYRPNKSAMDAVGVARQRCFRYEWVIDLDIKGFFDNIDHELLMKAVRKHTDSKWIHLYIERWLKVPAQEADGTSVKRERGLPQGGVISPLLANLYLHYAFDEWMRRENPEKPFERYADDVIVHCRSEYQAKWLKKMIEARMKDCKLELHPQKTKIVYCKNGVRKKSYPEVSFDFLGFTFMPRKARTREGKNYTTFSPAISQKAAKSIRQTIKDMKIHRRLSPLTLKDIARVLNPKIRGWLNYYGSFNKTALSPTFKCLNERIIIWAMNKFKSLKRKVSKAHRWLNHIKKTQPTLFAHWEANFRWVG